MSVAQEPSRGFIFMIAMTCALCVGCNYFNQPLIYSIAQDLSISVSQSAWIIFLTQIGYTAGLLFFVPLGDLFEKRRYICTLMLLTAFALIGLASSQNLNMLYGFTLLAAFCSIVSQILIPYVASLSSHAKSAEVIGLMMSGILIGVLLARTVAGLISTLWSWHAVYWISGCSIFLLSTLIWFKLPPSKPQLNISFLEIYTSLFHFSIKEPMLLRRSLIGCLSFSVMSIMFTTMPLILAKPPYSFNDFQIGLMGLVGIIGVWASAWTGKMIGQKREKRLALISTYGLIFAWLPLAFAQSSLTLYVIGLMIAYFSFSTLHVLNQNLVYRLSVSARSRINAIYMTCYFSGAGLGSFLCLTLWNDYGWYGCLTLGFCFAFIIFIVNLYDLNQKKNLISIDINHSS